MSSSSDSQTLSDIDRELIDFFVNAAQSFGLPKSYGEIFGLFFASDRPLAMDDVTERLQISKGSASQGIRFLRSINALVLSYLPGDRRDHYVAEMSLRRIADGFIRERIRPQLADGADRLKALQSQYGPEALAPYQERLRNIQSWRKKAELLLPFVSKFLSDKEKGRIL